MVFGAGGKGDVHVSLGCEGFDVTRVDEYLFVFGT